MWQMLPLQTLCHCPTFVWPCIRAKTPLPPLFLANPVKVIARSCQSMAKMQKSSQEFTDSRSACRFCKWLGRLIEKEQWVRLVGGWEGVSGKTECVLVLLLHLFKVMSSRWPTCFSHSSVFKLAVWNALLSFPLPIPDMCWSGDWEDSGVKKMVWCHNCSNRLQSV